MKLSRLSDYDALASLKITMQNDPELRKVKEKDLK